MIPIVAQKAINNFEKQIKNNFNQLEFVIGRITADRMYDRNLNTQLYLERLKLVCKETYKFSVAKNLVFYCRIKCKGYAITCECEVINKFIGLDVYMRHTVEALI